jgi:uncharacterized membrane protein (UPF0127 family)/Skp family chaperone for outer membrane proteins
MQQARLTVLTVSMRGWPSRRRRPGTVFWLTRRCRFMAIAACGVFVRGVLLASPLHAQAVPPASAHVGIVKLRIIYQNMKQSLEFEDVVKGMQDHLAAVVAEHQKQLNDLQKQIDDAVQKKTSRAELADLMDEKSMQFQMEEKGLKLAITHAVGRQLKKGFDQIQTAVQDLAATKGLDLVLVDDAPMVPPNAADINNLDSLAKLLLNREVLYVSDQVDFTAEVIAQLNSHFVPTSQPVVSPVLPTTKMQIGSKTYDLEIAADEPSQHRGMMERDTVENDHGMIFVFNTAGEQNFWGHHTRFPLDVVYVDAKGVIVSIKPLKAYDETNIPSDGDAKYAIELPAGQAAAAGLKAGSQLKIPPAVDAPVKK